MKKAVLTILTTAAFPGLMPAAVEAQDPPEAIEHEVDAFSVWKADGQVFQSSENLSTFVGHRGGPFFVKTEKGPVFAGTVVCAGMMEIEIDSAVQVGEGRCSITDDTGE
jgi:hypothetical protein